MHVGYSGGPVQGYRESRGFRKSKGSRGSNGPWGQGEHLRVPRISRMLEVQRVQMPSERGVLRETIKGPKGSRVSKFPGRFPGVQAFKHTGLDITPKFITIF